MKRWIMCGLLVVLAGGQAILAKEYRKAPAEVIDWPLPWTAGAKFDYDETSEQIIETRGVGTRSYSKGVSRISTLRIEDTGVVQGWSSLATLEKQSNTSDAEQAFKRSLEQAFSHVTLEVRLGTDGTYAGIANLEPIRAKFLGLTRDWMATWSRNASSPVSPEIAKTRQHLMDAFTSTAVLEGQLSILPTAYNFPAGGGLGLDYEYVYQDEGANPVGGEPFPMTGRMTLSRDELREGWLMLSWSLTMDREKGGPILAATVRKLMGEDAIAQGGKGTADALEQMAANLDFGSSARFRIDPATGVVQWMQLVQRRRVGERNDVRTTTLVLRSTHYLPVPGKPQPAAAESRL